MALMKTPSHLLEQQGWAWDKSAILNWSDEQSIPKPRIGPQQICQQGLKCCRGRQFTTGQSTLPDADHCNHLREIFFILIVSNLRRPRIIFSPDITPLGPTFVLNCCPVMVVQWRRRNHKKWWWRMQMCRQCGKGFNRCTSQKWDVLLREHHRISMEFAKINKFSMVLYAFLPTARMLWASWRKNFPERRRRESEVYREGFWQDLEFSLSWWTFFVITYDQCHATWSCQLSIFCCYILAFFGYLRPLLVLSVEWTGIRA